jgi:hypothetical protein
MNNFPMSRPLPIRRSIAIIPKSPIEYLQYVDLDLKHPSNKDIIAATTDVHNIECTIDKYPLLKVNLDLKNKILYYVKKMSILVNPLDLTDPSHFLQRLKFANQFIHHV